MYNALKYTQQLESAGFTRSQAESMVTLVIETMEQHFATKNDFTEMKGHMTAEFKAVRSEMATEFQAVRNEMAVEFKSVRHEMREMESRITLKLGAIMLGGIALLQFLD